MPALFRLALLCLPAGVFLCVAGSAKEESNPALQPVGPPPPDTYALPPGVVTAENPVAKVREAAATTAHGHNLKHITRAFHPFERAFGHLPSVGISQSAAMPDLSSRMAISPNIEQEPICQAV